MFGFIFLHTYFVYSILLICGIDMIVCVATGKLSSDEIFKKEVNSTDE
jgi:hypothetical protein